jgi:hypothetical protein
MTSRRATWAIVVGGPLLVGLPGLLAALAARPELPGRVAIHWGTAGPDGFASPVVAVLTVVLGPVTGVLAGGILLATGGGQHAVARPAAAVANGISAFVTVGAAGSLWLQRGLADGADAPDIQGVLVVAVVVAVPAAALAARLVPSPPPAATRATAPPGGAPPAPLRAGERVAWSARTTASPVAFAILASSLVPLAALAVAGVAPLFLGVTALLLVVLVVSLLAARVWVDERGLTVAAPLGRPVFRVPLSDVAAAGEVHVDPLTEFGGWGYRVAPGGRSGVVLRRGPALEVTRGDGTRFVVTVAGAGEAASLLTALAARSR